MLQLSYYNVNKCLRILNDAFLMISSECPFTCIFTSKEQMHLNTCIKFHLIVGDDSLKYMRNTLHFNHMVEINYISTIGMTQISFTFT